MGLSELSVRRGITVLMVFIAIVGFGLFNLSQIKLDLYPDITFPVIGILTQYEGAAPPDVEQLISKPIEESVASVEGITELESTSTSGSSIVLIHFAWGSDLDQAEWDVRKLLEFYKMVAPDDAEDPIAFAFDPSQQPIMFLSISGPQGLARLRKIAEDSIQPRLERAVGVASADVIGGLNRQINIKISPERMRAYRLSTTQVVSAIHSANKQIPAGEIEDGGVDYSILSEGMFTSVEQITSTIVGRAGKQVIALADIAEIEDGFEEQTQVARNNGKDSVMMLVRRQSDANTVVTADAVKKELKIIEEEKFEDISINTLFDQSETIKVSLGNLSSTAYQALILTTLVLLLFLGSARSAFIVGLSIPISVIATFAVMGQAGITLNIISMAGLALAIGMLVDNSIVVTENIFRHFSLGKTGIASASEGAQEVGMAITASTLTTLAVFGPILFVPGIAGHLFKEMALTICFSLAISLVVALTLIPMLASRLLWESPEIKAKHTKKGMFEKTSTLLDKLQIYYGRSLAWTVKNKWKTLLIGMIPVIASFVVGSLYLKTDFMAQSDSGSVELKVTAQPGTSLQDMDNIFKRIESIVKKEVPETISTNVRFGKTSGFSSMSGQNHNSGTLRIKLPPLGEKRSRRTSEIEDQLQSRFADIPGVEIKASRHGISGGEGDMEIRIFSEDIEELKSYGALLAASFRGLEGVNSANFSMEIGKPEIQVKLDRKRLKSLGISPSEVSSTLSTYFQGTVAGIYNEAGEDYDILVRTPPEIRNDARLVGEIPILTPTGDMISISSVARIVEGVGPTAIKHYNKKRLGSVAINKTKDAPLEELTSRIEEEMDKIPKPEGLSTTIAGSAEDMRDSFKYLIIAMLAAILLVYMVMASQFESLLEPFIILFSIPFCAVGVVFALLISDTPMQITAAIGLIMLVGIAVNNAIVLIDFIKHNLEAGLDPEAAVIEGGKTRLRPIILTTLTTVLGMAPLALELGEGSETWAPMARTVIGGLTASTLLTLFIIPVLYLLSYAVRNRAKSFFRRWLESR